MKFEVGDRVRPTTEYIKHDELTSAEEDEIMGLTGKVIQAFDHATKGSVYHVQFENAPYYPDYWVMYESEIELT